MLAIRVLVRTRYLPVARPDILLSTPGRVRRCNLRLVAAATDLSERKSKGRDVRDAGFEPATSCV